MGKPKWLDLAEEATSTPDYPRRAIVVENGKTKVIDIKDPVHDLAVNLKHEGNFAYVSPEHK